MVIAKSKLTTPGQRSIPAEVRQRLGVGQPLEVGPGSVVEWNQQDGRVVVRRAERFTSEEVHRALFPEGVPRYAPNAKEAVWKCIRKKHAGVESPAKQDDWSIQAGLPTLDFGGIRAAKTKAYIAAVHAALDRNYAPMTDVFRDVIVRTLLSVATSSD